MLDIAEMSTRKITQGYQCRREIELSVGGHSFGRISDHG